MIDKKLAQFFQYEKNNAIINLLIAARFAYSSTMNDHIVDKILELSEISMPAPLFLKHMDELMEKFQEGQADGHLYLDKLIRSPGYLQNHVITRLYYALYWSLCSVDNKEEIERQYVSQIVKIVLDFHYYYLRYKKEEQKKFRDSEEHQGESFFEEITQSLSRAVEYLSKMAQANSKYLNETYFDPTAENPGIHFLEFVTKDPVESNHFFIMKNESTDMNYLSYENDYEEIKLHVLPSRRLQSGGNKNSERNQNIVGFFRDGLIAYQKLIGLEFKGSRAADMNSGGVRYDKQYTEREELFNDTYVVKRKISEEAQYEEEQEVLQKQRIKRRVITDMEKETDIPNSFKQQQMNRAFSANVTKKLLMLLSAYEVPSKEHLAEFIAFLCEEPIKSAYEENDLFRVVFIFGMVTGYEYLRSIDIIFDNGKHVVLDLNEGTVAMEIDHTLFAKEKKNDYLEKSTKKITFAIPPLLVMLIRKMKIAIEMAGDIELDSLKSDESFKRYKKFIKDKVEAFGSTISINPDQVWRIVETYKKESFNEDMSTLFCVGKYQTNDRPRLAYASTHKEGQVHASFIQKLFIKLGLDDVIPKLLGLPQGLFKTMIKTDHHRHYAGSSRSVVTETAQRFFAQLKYMIRREDDEIVRFNLVAVYTKFALSLLLGSRSFEHSTYLGKISFVMHVLSLSEKSTTLLTGMRVIPLCERAEQIIKYYKRECMQLQVPEDHVYLINKNNKPEIYTKGLAVDILSHHSIDNEIIGFVNNVPVNIGRHVITKLAMETNFNGHYLEAFLGHYSSGAEQFGIFSTLYSREYIQKCRELTQKVAVIYGVQAL
ncbi:MAG TPA: hypothetical protein ENK98_00260 [Epsilonproteobacteria bacterium]|nr:hypothetical protein [Campylobacterota bacterium]